MSRLWKSVAVVLIVVVIAFVYQRFVADKAVSGRVLVPQPAARIGSASAGGLLVRPKPSSVDTGGSVVALFMSLGRDPADSASSRRIMST